MKMILVLLLAATIAWADDGVPASAPAEPVDEMAEFVKTLTRLQTGEAEVSFTHTRYKEDVIIYQESGSYRWVHDSVGWLYEPITLADRARYDETIGFDGRAQWLTSDESHVIMATVYNEKDDGRGGVAETFPSFLWGPLPLLEEKPEVWLGKNGPEEVDGKTLISYSLWSGSAQVPGVKIQEVRRFWADPTRGYLPVISEARVPAKDAFNKRNEKGENIVPIETRVLYRCRITQAEQIDGKWVPTKGVKECFRFGTVLYRFEWDLRHIAFEVPDKTVFRAGLDTGKPVMFTSMITREGWRFENDEARNMDVEDMLGVLDADRQRLIAREEERKRGFE